MQIYRKYITNISQIYHKYITNISQIYRKYIANISQIYRKYIANFTLDNIERTKKTIHPSTKRKSLRRSFLLSNRITSI